MGEHNLLWQMLWEVPEGKTYMSKFWNTMAPLSLMSQSLKAKAFQDELRHQNILILQAVARNYTSPQKLRREVESLNLFKAFSHSNLHSGCFLQKQRYK